VAKSSVAAAALGLAVGEEGKEKWDRLGSAEERRKRKENIEVKPGMEAAALTVEPEPERAEELSRERRM